MRSNRIFATRLLGLCLCLFAQRASAADLGAAEDYNVFVLNNFTQSSTDTYGAIAVGGNASLTSYTVASQFSKPESAPFSDTALVVGGTLTMTGGSVNGNMYVTGTVNYSDPTLYGNIYGDSSVTLGSHGTVYGGVDYDTTYSKSNTTVDGTATKTSSSSPVNFTTAAAYYKYISTQYSEMSQTGTNSVNGSGYVTLTGTSSSLNVFSLTASELSGAASQGITITAPSGSTVLMNIAGTSDTLKNFAFTLSGVTDQYILYNFYQATTVTDDNVAIYGTIMAPLATVEGDSGGSLNGTLIANNFSTPSIEVHSAQFEGTLPSETPEPGTASLVASGAVAAAFGVKRKRG